MEALAEHEAALRLAQPTSWSKQQSASTQRRRRPILDRLRSMLWPQHPGWQPNATRKSYLALERASRLAKCRSAKNDRVCQTKVDSGLTRITGFKRVTQQIIDKIFPLKSYRDFFTSFRSQPCSSSLESNFEPQGLASLAFIGNTGMIWKSALELLLGY
jgi:hypothetical protein